MCLHGGPGFPHDYLGNLELLADEKRVVFYDQLGCGRSPRPDGGEFWRMERSVEELWRAERFVEEVGRVREELGLERVHLLGQSWGGFLAARYALTNPEGLVSLVLASPLISVPRWLEDADALKAKLPPDVRATIDEHEAAGHTDCPEYVAASLVYWKRHVCRLDPWPERLERSFARLGLDVYRHMWGPSEFTATGNLRGEDLSDRLGELRVPTLLTCGRHDEATPEANAYYQCLLPGSELAVFEHSSHMPHLEEEDRYLEVLRSFLRRVEGQ